MGEKIQKEKPEIKSNTKPLKIKPEVFQKALFMDLTWRNNKDKFKTP